MFFETDELRQTVLYACFYFSLNQGPCVIEKALIDEEPVLADPLARKQLLVVGNRRKFRRIRLYPVGRIGYTFQGYHPAVDPFEGELYSPLSDQVGFVGICLRGEVDASALYCRDGMANRAFTLTSASIRDLIY